MYVCIEKNRNVCKNKQEKIRRLLIGLASIYKIDI